MDDNHNARAAGQRAALITVSIGLLLAVLIVASFGLHLRTPNAWFVFVDAVFCVVVFAYVVGGRVGVHIKNGGNPWLLGIGLALATVVVPTLVASLGVWAVEMLPHGLGRAVGELHSYVIKPLFWIVPAGVLPACALGALYGQLVRRRLESRPS